MSDLQKSFDRMQDKVLAIMDMINAGHKDGVDYGTGDRLSPVEAHTIQAVGDNQGLNLTALAQAMNVTKATMSERVKKLTRQGLLRKSKALDNRKEILITLAALYPRPVGEPAAAFHLPEEIVSTWIVVDVSRALLHYLGPWGLALTALLGLSLALIPLFDRPMFPKMMGPVLVGDEALVGMAPRKQGVTATSAGLPNRRPGLG